MNEEVTKTMMEKIEGCGYTTARIDSLVAFLREQQRIYAMDAEAHNFKYDSKLEDAKVAITDVLAILGCQSSPTALTIFDNHQMEMDLKKMQEKDHEETV